MNWMYLITENKNKKYFVLSGNKGFFSRYADNGFKNKWTGLWKNSVKFLEYYSIKGLEENYCEKTEFDFIKAKHFYPETVETLFIPKNKVGLYVEFEFKKEKEIELELAVNIRQREENLTNRKYEIKWDKKNNSITISNSLGELTFCLIKGKMKFIEEQKEKIHFPSGEKQNCVIPGKIFLKGKKIIFGLISEETKEKEKKKTEKALKKGNEKTKEKKLTEKQLKKEIEKRETENKKIDGLISCNYKELEKGFIDSSKGIFLLENNENFFAGYLWFLQYWGRDNLWSLGSLISLGEFEKAEKVLAYFWEKNQNGKIPNFIEKEKITFNSIDSSLLFLIGLKDYVFASGNKKILKKIDYWKVIKFLALQEKDGLIYHKGNETWMDSISREGKGIEIQALYLKALHSVRNLLVLEKKDELVHEIEKKAVELNRKIIEKYERNGIFADLLNEKKELIKTCNPLVYLMQKKASAKEIELFESKEFNCVKGILTRSSNEKSFNSEGYHTGLCWSLCTGWMSCAEFKAERKEKGIEYLEKLISDLNSDCIGGIGECWNFNGKLKGCGMQLWGHAFVIKIVDEFLLGIKLNAFEKKVFLKPQLPEKINLIKRKIRLGENWFNLTVERKKGIISAKTSNKKIKLEFY